MKKILIGLLTVSSLTAFAQVNSDLKTKSIDGGRIQKIQRNIDKFIEKFEEETEQRARSMTTVSPDYTSALDQVRSTTVKFLKDYSTHLLEVQDEISDSNSELNDLALKYSNELNQYLQTHGRTSDYLNIVKIMNNEIEARKNIEEKNFKIMYRKAHTELFKSSSIETLNVRKANVLEYAVVRVTTPLLTIGAGIMWLLPTPFPLVASPMAIACGGWEECDGYYGVLRGAKDDIEWDFTYSRNMDFRDNVSSTSKQLYSACTTRVCVDLIHNDYKKLFKQITRALLGDSALKDSSYKIKVRRIRNVLKKAAKEAKEKL